MTAPRDDSPTSRLVLSSAAFAEGTTVPARHTCEGENLSPQLAWTGVPVDTRSFALICDDPDAPRGTWVHWLLWNLPADAVELGEGVPQRPELPSGLARASMTVGTSGTPVPARPPGARTDITSGSSRWIRP